MSQLDAIAEILDTAALNVASVPQLSMQLSLDDAYRVQQASIDRRRARGERVIGYKMGFTSKAKMAQMNVHDIIWGQLTDAMKVDNGGQVDRKRFIHPRVEPEIAFRIGRELSGNISEDDAWAAVDAIAPALEIIDSRFEAFKFSLTDVVADNSSSSAFVVGDWLTAERNIGNLGMVMALDGEDVGFGSSAAILGHPIQSLISGARLLGEAGLHFAVGDIVMAGGATAAFSLEGIGRVSLRVEQLGDVGFSVAGAI